MTNTIVKNVKDGSTNQIMSQIMTVMASGAEGRRFAPIVEATRLTLLGMAGRSIKSGNSKKYEIYTKAIEEITKLKANERKKLTTMLDTLSKISGYSVQQIIGNSRKMEVCSVRQIYCYVGSKTFAPLQEIGKVVARGHATVIHSNNVIESILSTNHWDDKSIYVKEILNKYDKTISGNLN